MQMSFHLGFKETILFKSWRTTDGYGLFASAIGIILMGIMYEAIKNYREYLKANKAIHFPRKVASRRVMIFSTLHILQTFLQVIQSVLGFFLMLVFMTYNGYLWMAVVLGSTIGYYVFSWRNAAYEIGDCCS